MQKDLCRIKGSRDGLVITIRDGAQFTRVMEGLEKQLSSAQSFFAGASARLFLEEGRLNSQQVEEIEKLLAAFGMKLEREPFLSAASAGGEGQALEQSADSQREHTLLVRRTIRSGQSVSYDGNVVIMGDVNPGAEVICSGDILVLGSLRGVAHAGAEGKVDATVFAFRLEPTQLRIAHYISRAPDEKAPQPSGPEIARVVENWIQVSNYNY